MERKQTLTTGLTSFGRDAGLSRGQTVTFRPLPIREASRRQPTAATRLPATVRRSVRVLHVWYYFCDQWAPISQPLQSVREEMNSSVRLWHLRLCANTPSLSLDGALGNGKMASTGTDAFTDPVISLLSLHKTGANGSFMECFGGSFSPRCTLWRCWERQLISVESINNIMQALSQWPAKRFSTISPQISVTSKCFLTSFSPKTKGCK